MGTAVAKPRVIKPRRGQAAPYTRIKGVADVTEIKDVVVKDRDPTAGWGVADRVANDGFCHRNFSVPLLREAFPLTNKMWFVDKMYPYAESGPLFVDEPRSLDEKAMCEEKRKVLADAKVQYLVINENMTATDCIQELNRR